MKYYNVEEGLHKDREEYFNLIDYKLPIEPNYSNIPKIDTYVDIFSNYIIAPILSNNDKYNTKLYERVRERNDIIVDLPNILHNIRTDRYGYSIRYTDSSGHYKRVKNSNRHLHLPYALREHDAIVNTILSITISNPTLKDRNSNITPILDPTTLSINRLEKRALTSRDKKFIQQVYTTVPINIIEDMLSYEVPLKTIQTYIRGLVSRGYMKNRRDHLVIWKSLSSFDDTDT
jgi:hypothetical protein